MAARFIERTLPRLSPSADWYRKAQIAYLNGLPFGSMAIVESDRLYEMLMQPGGYSIDHIDLSVVVAELVRRPDWMAQAACSGRPEINFFPGNGEHITPAQEVCASCSVREECLDYALGLEFTGFGVWGGTSQKRRKAIRNGRVTADISAA